MTTSQKEYLEWLLKLRNKFYNENNIFALNKVNKDIEDFSKKNNLKK
ncbi:MAG: hypothetical protein GY823_11870 [Flavobacteriaceae bacterium]|nr:hypothetical protein [Flavobacteriaceae bacterium]